MSANAGRSGALSLTSGTSGRTEVPLRFRVPEEFQELDLTEPSAMRLNRTFNRIRSATHQFTDTEVLQIAMNQEFMAMRLVEEGAVYSGTCVARTEDVSPRLVVAILNVLVKEVELDADEPLSAVASGLKRPGDPRDVGFVDLPAGKALMVAEKVSVEFPATTTGVKTKTRRKVRQLQATIPFPDKNRIAIFSLSSESENGWEEFLTIFGCVLRSVSFQPPGVASIAARLNAL
ncbi:MAG: hypothetical protein ACRDQF_00675 [Thermocrispum sp.]